MFLKVSGNWKIILLQISKLVLKNPLVVYRHFIIFLSTSGIFKVILKTYGIFEKLLQPSGILKMLVKV